MKTNLPITNVETLLPEGEFIYSATDLKGVIVEANEAFAKVSHYAREAMIGQSHNLVRHPDIPPEAFSDMWRDLKAGRPWRGIVKNRRKDGGFYWVVANVSPVRENGQVVGYQSVRSRPSREEIAAAEGAYKRIKDGDTSLQIRHGRVVRHRPEWLSNLLSVRSQMIIAGLTALIPAVEALSDHLGGPTFPDTLSIVIAAVAILYSLYFLLHYVPQTTRDLNVTSDWLESVLSSGDLRQRLNLERRDVIGGIARKADKFTSSVQATIQGIADIARQVSSATTDVHSGMKVSHDSAVKQSEATSSAAAAIEEVTVSIGEVATHARMTEETATRTGEVSHQGTTVTQNASRKIESLADTVRQSAEQVESLGQRSEEIGRVTDVIKEIADQTNLLALNAAIEAARAGDAGRGFAVVADEVRKLAEKTMASTQDVSQAIKSIQDSTAKSMGSMDNAVNQIARATDFANQSGQALEEIVATVESTADQVNAIATASEEQSAASEEINRSIVHVNEISRQSAIAMAEATQAVSDLAAQAHTLKNLVAQMKLG